MILCMVWETITSSNKKEILLFNFSIMGITNMYYIYAYTGLQLFKLKLFTLFTIMTYCLTCAPTYACSIYLYKQEAALNSWYESTGQT